jgi:hypothetical protein
VKINEGEYMKLTELLNEDAAMNKMVKSLLDKELNDLSKGRPNHQFAVMHILKGALTDANFHSVSKKVPSLFPKAEYEGDPMAEQDLINIYEYKIGPKIANICKWDGKDIVNAIGFYVSMTIGRPMGEKIEKLVESKGMKIFKESAYLNESNYQIYHKSFSSAADAARTYAEKKGFKIDEDDWQTQVALGGKYSRSRPGIGKTHSFTVGLLKNDKPQRKGLNFSVYGMESGNFELTAYIN